MIGLMIPNVFAAFPDPDKDPRHYLIRYYTEQKYQEWFDSQFPNTTIEEKVGYPNKIITDKSKHIKQSNNTTTNKQDCFKQAANNYI